MTTPVVEKLRRIFQWAERLNADLWADGIDPAYMSVEQLCERVHKECGVVIEIKLVDVETAHIYGFVERYDDGKRAVIYVVKNIPPRFKTAVIAKELCQVLLDTKEDWSINGADTLQRLIVGVVEYDEPENIPARSEIMAERLSWELLYPYELRLKDLAESIQQEQIATRVRLPLHIVNLVLSQSYMDWCRRWWEVITNERRARAAEER